MELRQLKQRLPDHVRVRVVQRIEKNMILDFCDLVGLAKQCTTRLGVRRPLNRSHVSTLA